MNTVDIPIREKDARIENRYAEQEQPCHDNQYFVIGNNRIIINEHFKNDGKPLETILEKVILNAGNDHKNDQKTA